MQDYAFLSFCLFFRKYVNDSIFFIIITEGQVIVPELYSANERWGGEYMGVKLTNKWK